MFSISYSLALYEEFERKSLSEDAVELEAAQALKDPDWDAISDLNKERDSLSFWRLLEILLNVAMNLDASE